MPFQRKIKTHAGNNKGVYEIAGNGPSVVPSSDATKRTYKGSKIGEEAGKAVNPSNKFYGKMKNRKEYWGGGTKK